MPVNKPVKLRVDEDAKYLNSGKTQTSFTTLLDLHYAKLGILDVWNKQRVLRLCGALNITTFELASIIMFPHDQMAKCIQKELFPGPVAILLTILENTTIRNSILDPFPPDSPSIFPFNELSNGSS